MVSTIVLLAGLVGRRCWEPRILGQGAEEFRRVGAAVRAAIVVLALAGLAVHAHNLGPWVFGMLPATGVALVFSRYGLRRVLHARRSRGGCMVPVLVAGGVEEVADLIARTRREAHNGWLIEAVCVPAPPDGAAPTDVCGVPVVGDLDEVATLVRRGGYRVVVAAPDPAWTRRRLRDMAWELEGTPAALIVAPTLMEVTGPRLHVSPVYGLTLLRVSKPSFTGVRWLLKDVIERIGAVGLLAVVAPLFLVIALAIKLDGGGPVLYRQERVGKGGKTFMMLKFRSMVVDAEHLLGALEAGNEGAGPLFKLRHDPRVSRIGSLLRRYSLDELPQLLNVVRGHMSLVGPRPPLPREVARYATDGMRRLLDAIGSADLVLTAERTHRSIVVQQAPTALGKTFCLREFARLMASVECDGMPSDPVALARAAVVAARDRRGLIPPVPPSEDDIADPKGLDQAAHHAAALAISSALAQILGVPSPVVAQGRRRWPQPIRRRTESPGDRGRLWGCGPPASWRVSSRWH